MCIEILFGQFVRLTLASCCYYAKKGEQTSSRIHTILDQERWSLMQPFTNRVILITGAGSGIGGALARRLAAEGATLPHSIVSQGRCKLSPRSAQAPPGRWQM